MSRQSHDIGYQKRVKNADQVEQARLRRKKQKRSTRAARRRPIQVYVPPPAPVRQWWGGY